MMLCSCPATFMVKVLIMFVEVYFQTSSTLRYWGLNKRKLLKARNIKRNRKPAKEKILNIKRTIFAIVIFLYFH